MSTSKWKYLVALESEKVTLILGLRPYDEINYNTRSITTGNNAGFETYSLYKVRSYCYYGNFL